MLLYNRPQISFTPSAKWERREKEFIHEPGHVPEPYTKSDSIWILDFADPRTARNQLPLFDPVYGILLYCWFQKKQYKKINTKHLEEINKCDKAPFSQAAQKKRKNTNYEFQK